MKRPTPAGPNHVFAAGVVIALTAALAVAACRHGSSDATTRTVPPAVSSEPTSDESADRHTPPPDDAAVEEDADALFDRIKQALEQQEVSGANCSNNGGCPAKTANPAGQPASFGWTQVTVETALSEMAIRGVPECIGDLDDDEVSEARKRSTAAGKWFAQVVDHSSGGGDTAAIRAAFISETELSAADYDAMLSWKEVRQRIEKYVPSRNAKNTYAQIVADGVQLDALLSEVGMTKVGLYPYLRARIWGEARQAFKAKAALGPPGSQFRQHAMMLFTDKHCFDQLSDRMIDAKMVANEARWPSPASDDAYSFALGALVAFNHNAGHVWNQSTPDPLILPMKSSQFAEDLWCFGYVVGFYRGFARDRTWSCASHS